MLSEELVNQLKDCRTDKDMEQFILRGILKTVERYSDLLKKRFLPIDNNIN